SAGKPGALHTLRAESSQDVMKFVFLNQAFHPDVAATGQYLTDVALALVGRGHEVTALTGRRAYDHPATVYPSSQTWRGIQIVRVVSTGFGKGSKCRRILDFASFIAAVTWRLVRVPRPDVVVALTSPPLISFPAAWLSKIRGCSFVYWVMDLNP